MAVGPLHLGWFMNFTPGEWDHPLGAGGAPWDGRFYVDMAQGIVAGRGPTQPASSST